MLTLLAPRTEDSLEDSDCSSHQRSTLALSPLLARTRDRAPAFFRWRSLAAKLQAQVREQEPGESSTLTCMGVCTDDGVEGGGMK